MTQLAGSPTEAVLAMAVAVKMKLLHSYVHGCEIAGVKVSARAPVAGVMGLGWPGHC